jgi:hypothetical protein
MNGRCQGFYCAGSVGALLTGYRPPGPAAGTVGPP